MRLDRGTDSGPAGAAPPQYLSPLLPTIPRLPLIGDPLLRRIRMPADLDAVTTVGDEVDPAEAGIDRGAGRGDLGRRRSSLYRSGVHPALQLCVRREGEVVARPRDRPRARQRPDDATTAPKVPATTETPFCVYSTSKAMTALVVHMLVERGVLALDDPIADHIPEYARHGKGEITIGHVLAHRAGVAVAAARGARPRPARRPRAPRRAHLRREADLGAGQAARLPRGLGRLHPRRGRRAGHRQADPRRARRGVPRPARLPLGQLRRRPGGRRARSASATSPARGCCRRSRTSSRGRSARRSTR